MPNSLTHRIDPCQHLVITECLEVCGRNCRTSKEASEDRIRDLDRIFLCPLCPKVNDYLTAISKDKDAGAMQVGAKTLSIVEPVPLEDTAVVEYNGRGQSEPVYKAGNMQIRTIKCKAVL